MLSSKSINPLTTSKHYIMATSYSFGDAERLKDMSLTFLSREDWWHDFE
jgi:hypothetical protein